MSFDFLNVLMILTIFTGVICLVDILIGGRHQRGADQKYPWVIEYARAFFPVFLIVLIIRSFIAQPYRVPTGSLEPTILPTGLILVTQFDYSLRMPLWNVELAHFGNPQRGQIILFHWPVNPQATFVKRLIGLPGDRISYIHKILYVNGKEATQTFVGNAIEQDPSTPATPVKEYQENLLGVVHRIYRSDERETQNFKDLVVPVGEYFFMGDNRDDSDDSRSWGFVRADAIIGRARWIWFSWDPILHKIRWNQIGKRL